MSAPGTAREEHQAMEFSVTKSALLNELSTTQGVVERKTTIPILSNLLVEAKGSQLTITATDLELSIRTSCEAKIKKEGAGTIPAKKLLELVRLLPEGEIKVQAARESLGGDHQRQEKIQARRHGQGKFPGAPSDAAHARKDFRSSHGEPDRQNKICYFDGRVTLHVEWRLADFEAGHSGHGRHRRPPPGACRNRSETRRA